MCNVFMMVVYRRIEHGMYSMGIFVCIVKHVQSCRYSIEMYVCIAKYVRYGRHSILCTVSCIQYSAYSLLLINKCFTVLCILDYAYLLYCTVHMRPYKLFTRHAALCKLDFPYYTKQLCKLYILRYQTILYILYQTY